MGCGRDTPGRSLFAYVEYPFDSASPRCSRRSRGGLPARFGRVRGTVCHRGSVSGLPVALALAGRLPVFGLRARTRQAGAESLVSARPMRATDLGDRWHTLDGLTATMSASSTMTVSHKSLDCRKPTFSRHSTCRLLAASCSEYARVQPSCVGGRFVPETSAIEVMVPITRIRTYNRLEPPNVRVTGKRG
jgi:hypothetical protein